MFENLQKTIDTFIGEFGTETLIQYLQDFQHINSKSYYKYIAEVCKEVSVYCKVKENQVLNIKNTDRDVVDARRHIVYFITIHIDLPNQIITKLFNCKIRTVYKYQREIKDRLENKNIYKEYHIMFNNLKQKINVPT